MKRVCVCAAETMPTCPTTRSIRFPQRSGVATRYVQHTARMFVHSMEAILYVLAHELFLHEEKWGHCFALHLLRGVRCSLTPHLTFFPRKQRQTTSANKKTALYRFDMAMVSMCEATRVCLLDKPSRVLPIAGR